jgi:hypothetical protein
MSGFKRVLSNIFLEQEKTEEVKTFEIPKTYEVPKPIPQSVVEPSLRIPQQVPQPQFTDANDLEDPEILKTFEDYLIQINKPGYDFHEFYNAVKSFEDTNSYKTAFSVVNSFDKTLTKEKLVFDSDFYVEKINQTVEDLKGMSSKKLSELNQERTSSESDVNNRISDCHQRLLQVQAEYEVLISSKPEVSRKFDEDIKQVERKMKSILYYQNKFVTSINKVKNNIINFL